MTLQSKIRTQLIVAAVAVGLTTGLTAFWLLTPASSSNVAGAQITADIQTDETELMTLSNHERTKQNLTSLSWNHQLYQAANQKAEHLLTKQYFDHVSPDGVTPWSFIADTGYTYQSAGENLAVGFTETTAIVPAWMNSPTHRANIVDPDFTQMAIATARGTLAGKAVTVVVQMFGQPK